MSPDEPRYESRDDSPNESRDHTCQSHRDHNGLWADRTRMLGRPEEELITDLYFPWDCFLNFLSLEAI